MYNLTDSQACIGAVLKGNNSSFPKQGLLSGSKSFPLRVAPIFETVLGRIFQDFPRVFVRILPFWLRHCFLRHYSLRKHVYSNILKILPPQNENFQIKNSDNFHVSAQNIDCGYSLEPPRRGGSNEYPQSMFLSRNKKNNVYPCKPQFYYIKEGFRGVKIM